ncbi:hypothetical protein [Chitinophaga filiformis]|uniref:Uncharacterized protein n=1 Tax=Chitinophaga filiformis TaxID=104663 RepID=A0A1G7N9Q7_CHIFI|nr:hypothetical protein [Chitinophaga filiformis]SDF70686.1 hypothetical protein SAMN04488121_102717 [Chitinophaga filiformis]
MRGTLIIILILKMSTGFCQSDTNVVVNKNAKLKKIVFESQEVSVDEINEGRIARYADSINCYRRGELPYFLTEACFDYRRSFWPSFHSPISVRWSVLKQVKNKKALKRILNTNDPRLKRTCYTGKQDAYGIVVPDIEKSFFDLLKERYDQL